MKIGVGYWCFGRPKTPGFPNSSSKFSLRYLRLLKLTGTPRGNTPGFLRVWAPRPEGPLDYKLTSTSSTRGDGSTGYWGVW